MLAVELVRREKELALGDLFHAIFKLTIVGAESLQLRDIGFARAAKRYVTELKRLEEDRLRYLPDSTASDQPTPPQGQSK